MPPCASSSSWSGLQHSLQVVPLQHSRLGRRPAGGPPLSIPCRRTSPPRAPGGSPSIAGRGPLRFPQRGGSHAPSLTPSWCCVCTPALAGSTTLRGLVNCQAAHTATAQHRSPRSRAQGKGESLTTAHAFQNLEVSTTGRIEDRSQAHTFPRSVTAWPPDSHKSAMRCVTCRGDGCGHRGVVPVPRVRWPGAEQGFHGGKASCCSRHVICQTTERIHAGARRT